MPQTAAERGKAKGAMAAAARIGTKAKAANEKTKDSLRGDSGKPGKGKSKRAPVESSDDSDLENETSSEEGDMEVVDEVEEVDCSQMSAEKPKTVKNRARDRPKPSIPVVEVTALSIFNFCSFTFTDSLLMLTGSFD